MSFDNPQTYSNPPQQNQAPSYPTYNNQTGAQLGQAQNQQSQAVAGYQGGLILGNYQNQQGLLNQDMANQLASLGIDASNLGIQEGALQRQGPLAEALNNLQTRGYDINYNATLSAEEQAKYGADRSQHDLMGNAAARGAVTTEGTRLGVQDIQKNLGWQLDSISRQRQSIDLARQGQSLNWEEKLSSLKDQQKFLDNASSKLGLSKNEIVLRTQQALNQLGLNTFLSVGDILNQLVSAGQGTFGSYVDPNVQKVLQQAGLSGVAGLASGGGQ